MSLKDGTKLGSYEIIASIGAGGMGEVYKARDTKLGREVAIKVLPEAFSQDEERLARFEREARLLASLNHTNIATIYDLEESDGVNFLVLEYVPGETLAERISKGPIPVDEALPLFTQIAEGLQAAHDNGVLHRDLKPANIKVTPEGKVKVLDFGLAKAFGEEAPVANMSSSPTLTRQATQAGVILGTAPYMSPEQAQGKPVDKQTDIWAFGCCLYETLTGRKAFTGETVTDVLAAVIKSEPDLDFISEGVHWKLRQLLERCLQKDPAWRLRDIADGRLDLEDALCEPDLGPVSEATSRHPILTPLVIALIAAILGGVLVWSLTRPEPPVVKRFAIQLPEGDRLIRPSPAMAISPNGKSLIYAAEREGTTHLFERQMDEIEARQLPGTEGARGPFFSPDGEWIGFWADGILKKMLVAGGTPINICEVIGFFGASWAPDDTIFFSGGGAGLWRVAASGGEPEQFTILEDGEFGHARPEVLPNGKAILFHIYRGTNPSCVVVISLESNQQRILVEGASSARYSPTGHLLYARRETGWIEAVRFDTERLEVVGSAVPAFHNVWWDYNAHFIVSNDGSLLYVPRQFEDFGVIRLVWVDREGEAQILTDEGRSFEAVSISPDGRQVVGESNGDIWMVDLARDAWTRLTFGASNAKPIWSPDGSQIYFASTRGGGAYQVSVVPSDGIGEARQLTDGTYRVPTSVSLDGRSLFFRQRGEDGGWDIGILHLDVESEPELLMATPFNEHSGMISPDGRWLAYVSNESGRDEIYVRPFPDMNTEWSISTDGGTEPLWSPDGSELFYRNNDQMLAVSISSTPSFAPGRPKLLFEGAYLRADRALPFTAYDVTADGQRFVMLQPAENAAPRQINVVLNWSEELKRLAPKD